MTTTTADLTVERDAESRQQRLATAVRGLRTKAGGTDGARLLLFFGGILLPLGFVVILLGWIGASRTVNLYEQIPYSISGGMLGMALVFAGGFCYFAYWLTQLVYAARRDNADTRILLERIEELLSSGASFSAVPAVDGAPVASRRQVASVATVAPVVGGSYLATPTGTMFHAPSCPAVAGRDNLREVHGDEAGLTACKICEPLSS
jgi:hypothetical protein